MPSTIGKLHAISDNPRPTHPQLFISLKGLYHASGSIKSGYHVGAFSGESPTKIYLHQQAFAASGSFLPEVSRDRFCHAFPYRKAHAAFGRFLPS